jgi:integral membrane protein (TIGR01906 family)
MKRPIFISILLFVILFFIIILSSTFIVIFNQSFYERECKQLGTDCEKSIGVLNYLNNKTPLNSEFNEREIDHMKDVKNLIIFFMIFYLILLIIFLAVIILNLLYNQKNFANFLVIYLIYGGVFSILITVLFSLMIFFGFEFIFNLFHGIFFKSGTWIFSQEDLLIKLFPIGFFMDSAKAIIYSSLILSGALTIIGLLIKKFK